MGSFLLHVMLDISPHVAFPVSLIAHVFDSKHCFGDQGEQSAMSDGESCSVNHPMTLKIVEYVQSIRRKRNKNGQREAFK